MREEYGRYCASLLLGGEEGGMNVNPLPLGEYLRHRELFFFHPGEPAAICDGLLDG